MCEVEETNSVRSVCHHLHCRGRETETPVGSRLSSFGESHGGVPSVLEGNTAPARLRKIRLTSFPTYGDVE